jgi:hypothetical protein
MPLILLSGRPGAGKTKYGQWLASEKSFVHVQTDIEPAWITDVLVVETLDQAIGARNRVRTTLGPNVVMEWGFLLQFFSSVKLLRAAGFDPWWFDGDEPGARQGWIAARGSQAPLHLYEQQVKAIEAARSGLEKFYGDHIIRTVSSGPTYVSLGEIAAAMFSEA